MYFKYSLMYICIYVCITSARERKTTVKSYIEMKISDPLGFCVCYSVSRWC